MRNFQKCQEAFDLFRSKIILRKVYIPAGLVMWLKFTMTLKCQSHDERSPLTNTLEHILL